MTRTRARGIGVDGIQLGDRYFPERIVGMDEDFDGVMRDLELQNRKTVVGKKTFFFGRSERHAHHPEPVSAGKETIGHAVTAGKKRSVQDTVGVDGKRAQGSPHEVAGTSGGRDGFRLQGAFRDSPENRVSGLCQGIRGDLVGVLQDRRGVHGAENGGR